MTSPIQWIKDLGGAPQGLIHIGAHSGQEFEDYQRALLNPVLYIEALPSIYERLVAHIGGAEGHVAINALCSDKDGESVSFKVSSNEGASSSMLDFGWHSSEHPEVHWVDQVSLTTCRLDTLLADVQKKNPDLPFQKLNVLVLDVQGAEMKVLAGADDIVSKVDWISTEVNEGGLYEGDCSLDQIYAYMRGKGFRLKHLEMTQHRWGNALFARDTAHRRSAGG
ncbi:FkbM family methyltransferase [Microvirga flavescens]|uniref:FkbM family methyltransferase n=1 Tax=Microvirga flavescens TaxID=2249811 RepID=UPI000DDBA050|nr:FkbM family methyltransferase [Microvirga flavescens]